jgi:hypothetical protein
MLQHDPKKWASKDHAQTIAADKSDSTKSNRIYRVKVTNAKGTKP